AEQVFTLPSDSAPLMVLFDKANRVLKSTEFHKEKKEWLYQLKNAGEFADRADAVSALEKIKNDDEVVSALGNALRNDKFRCPRDSGSRGLRRFSGRLSPECRASLAWPARRRQGCAASRTMVGTRQAHSVPHRRNSQFGQPGEKQSGHHQANCWLPQRTQFPGSHGGGLLSRGPR